MPADIDPADPTVDLSIVVPIYNEEDSLLEMHRRLSEVLAGLGVSYEVLLVNDGSDDLSAELIGDLVAQDPTVRGIHFSRNFGHQAALAAGLQHCAGRVVVVIDADLQDPPELIGEMLERWRDGYEVVYAQRVARRRESLAKRATAYAFYRILRRITPVEIPSDTGDFCLMDRRIVELLNAMPERNRYVRGLRAWVGFRQTSVTFERAPRFAGEAKYTFAKSVGLAINGILSLSKLPLRLATYFGLLVSAASFILAIWFFVQRITGQPLIRGWSSTVVIVLFLGGVQLLTIGIIGEYLSRIYDEVKGRPLYVVRARDGFETHALRDPVPASRRAFRAAAR